MRQQAEAMSRSCVVLLGFALPLSTAATNVLLILLITAWSFSGKIMQSLKLILMHPVARMFGWLFALFAIGSLYSLGDPNDILTMINKMLKLLYFPIILSLMQEEKWRRYTLWAFLGAMAVTVMVASYRHMHRFPVNLAVAKVFKDSIYTGLMMAFASFVSAHFFSVSSNKAGRFLFGSLVLVFSFYTLFMNPGRVGYGIFLALAGLFLIRQRLFKMRLWILIGLLIFLIITLSYSTVLQNRVMAVWSDIVQYQAGNVNTSVGERLSFFQHTLILSLLHPWFGSGTGSFATLYDVFASAHHLIKTDNPHNEYLNIFFQLGLVGLIALLGLFLTLYRQLKMVVLPDRWLAEGLLAAMVVGCLANSWMMNFTAGYFFVILMAVLFGSTFLPKKDLM
jgi:O-antigen ligase